MLGKVPTLLMMRLQMGIKNSKQPWTLFPELADHPSDSHLSIICSSLCSSSLFLICLCCTYAFFFFFLLLIMTSCSFTIKHFFLTLLFVNILFWLLPRMLIRTPSVGSYWPHCDVRDLMNVWPIRWTSDKTDKASDVLILLAFDVSQL